MIEWHAPKLCTEWEQTEHKEIERERERKQNETGWKPINGLEHYQESFNDVHIRLIWLSFYSLPPPASRQNLNWLDGDLLQ